MTGTKEVLGKDEKGKEVLRNAGKCWEGESAGISREVLDSAEKCRKVLESAGMGREVLGRAEKGWNGQGGSGKSWEVLGKGGSAGKDWKVPGSAVKC